jgi:hypothetical protein
MCVVPLAISAYLENGGLGTMVCLCNIVFKWERMVWKLLKRSKQLLETNGRRTQVVNWVSKLKGGGTEVQEAKFSGISTIKHSR